MLSIKDLRDLKNKKEEELSKESQEKGYYSEKVDILRVEIMLLLELIIQSQK